MPDLADLCDRGIQKFFPSLSGHLAYRGYRAFARESSDAGNPDFCQCWDTEESRASGKDGLPESDIRANPSSCILRLKIFSIGADLRHAQELRPLHLQTAAPLLDSMEEDKILGEFLCPWVVCQPGLLESMNEAHDSLIVPNAENTFQSESNVQTG